MRPRRSLSVPAFPKSAFVGFRFPPEIIVLAIRWYLRYGLSYRDLEVLLGERGIEGLSPAAFHNTQQYANNLIECDHGRLEARLRPMRGLKISDTAQVIVRGHALMQNTRRGHDELAIAASRHRRVASAFTELASTI